MHRTGIFPHPSGTVKISKMNSTCIATNGGIMNVKNAVSRRRFMGGMVAAAGYFGLGPNIGPITQSQQEQLSMDYYDWLAKLSYNENPYGPTEPVLKAMNDAFKYANRYDYPDRDIVQTIAKLHGVQPQNVLLGAGSTELLEAMGTAFLRENKKVIGVEPTYSTVYQHATGLNARVIRLPLRSDYQQNIPAIIQAAKENSKEVGFIYLCNPNNPTGIIVPKDEMKQLLDGIPQNMPILIDEAYHHFVEDPNYATSIPFMIEGRPVVVTRTFSKMFALGGMRLGYAIAPRNLIERMRLYIGSKSVNALVKWGGVAALEDTAGQAQVRKETIRLRENTVAALHALGYDVIPSETNYFMVNIRRTVMPAISEFRQRGILVGRPFPPMTRHLRVSVGTAEEMDRFLSAFKQIFPYII
jgi:histidinol-phosphate aminotransferase